MTRRVWLVVAMLGIACPVACGKGTAGWVLETTSPTADLSSNDGGAAGQAGSISAEAGQAGESGAGGAAQATPVDRCPTRFASACSPNVIVNDKDATGSGRLFTSAVDDPSTTLSCITRDVCDILYRKTSQIHNMTKITIVIEDYAGVSETWSSAPGEAIIHMSSRHLQQVSDAHGDVRSEIHSIFYYHATNIYQFDGGNGVANAWLVSGVANYVRHVAGYMPDSQRKAGGAYNDGGLTTGFFLAWLDQAYPDFVYELNLSLDPSNTVTWTTQSFADVTGQSVALLWANYQASL